MKTTDNKALARSSLLDAVMLAAPVLAVHHDGDGAGKGMMDVQSMKESDMMQGMMARQMVATEEGGFVVHVGSYLLKYNSNLELIGKARIELSGADLDAMLGECVC